MNLVHLTVLIRDGKGGFENDRDSIWVNSDHIREVHPSEYKTCRAMVYMDYPDPSSGEEPTGEETWADQSLAVYCVEEWPLEISGQC